MSEDREWQPIATVPKDGDLFLAVGHGYSLLRWLPNSKAWFDGREAKKCNLADHYTHWMRLPEPPEAID